MKKQWAEKFHLFFSFLQKTIALHFSQRKCNVKNLFLPTE
jgi:hypothetical protein